MCLSMHTFYPAAMRPDIYVCLWGGHLQCFLHSLEETVGLGRHVC
jgi:hypothetical protein